MYDGFTSACFLDRIVHPDRNSCVAFRSSNNPNKNKQDPSEIRFRSLSSDKTSSQSRYRANISCFICFDFCFTRSIAAAQPTYCSKNTGFWLESSRERDLMLLHQSRRRSNSNLTTGKSWSQQAAVLWMIEATPPRHSRRLLCFDFELIGFEKLISYRRFVVFW